VALGKLVGTGNVAHKADITPPVSATTRKGRNDKGKPRGPYKGSEAVTKEMGRDSRLIHPPASRAVNPRSLSPPSRRLNPARR